MPNEESWSLGKCVAGLVSLDSCNKATKGRVVDGQQVLLPWYSGDWKSRTNTTARPSSRVDCGLLTVCRYLPRRRALFL